MRERNWRAREAGTSMADAHEGAAQARAKTWTGISHLGLREQRCWLAKREQPERGHDRREESAISGRGKRAAGWRARSSPRQRVTMDRNGSSEGQGTAMPACEE